MVEITKQLRNEEFRFRKIIKDTKRPTTKRTVNYKWNELHDCESYCVDCGHGNLFVVDFDNKEIVEKQKETREEKEIKE